jgi:3-carboxy-cis,cis-muconate cycloisomerase
MSLLDPLFGSAEVNRIFSDEQGVQRMLDFESALAGAEARAGVIPQSVPGAIASQCKVQYVDLPQLAQDAAGAGNLAIPLVKQLTGLVSKIDPEAARYVHWGATSQDVIDTALILQCRDAFHVIASRLDALRERLAELSNEHRATPMVARTWMQHAVPTVFGLKVAGWLDAVGRHRQRLAQTQDRVLALQFGGAAGTLAALGESGLQVSTALAEELKLTLPLIPWHSHRDRMAEMSATLALLVGTLGKIARDVSLQMQTEVSELLEPAAEGAGGSSTMPHKRNPVACSVVLAAAARVPPLAGTLLAAMPQEHERGLGGWQAEWETVPQIFRLTAGALHRTVEMMDAIEVRTERMAQNLDQTRGLVFAEAVTMELAKHVGKSQAHGIVEAAARQAASSGRSFRQILDSAPSVTAHLSSAQLDLLFQPLHYTGASGQFIERVLKANTSQEEGKKA